MRLAEFRPLSTACGESLDRGMQERSQRARLRVQEVWERSCYQALVEPGMTEKRLRRMRRIDGLLDCED
jgi:hypothetical protein